MKFGFLKSATLLGENLPCDLTGAPDVDTAEFLVERRRLKDFVKVCSDDARSSMVDGGPMELLRFIKDYNLDICVPNVVIGLRIFLTVAMSSVGCERTFSKLKLIKSYLTRRQHIFITSDSAKIWAASRGGYQKPGSHGFPGAFAYFPFYELPKIPGANTR